VALEVALPAPSVKTTGVRGRGYAAEEPRGGTLVRSRRREGTTAPGEHTGPKRRRGEPERPDGNVPRFRSAEAAEDVGPPGRGTAERATEVACRRRRRGQASERRGLDGSRVPERCAGPADDPRPPKEGAWQDQDPEVARRVRRRSWISERRALDGSWIPRWPAEPADDVVHRGKGPRLDPATEVAGRRRR